MLTDVGAYRIVRLLGSGGMGSVYEAVHATTQKRVAIKMLLPHLSQQPDVAARFVNEARAVSMIEHPAIVKVFDFGRLPDGSTYLVMEFLEGETLGARFKRQGPSLGLAVSVCRELALALAATHARNIIHRDLKPDNVVLVGDQVKVLDFGIAKIASDAELAPGQGVRTRTGVVLGTPTYMSPEQCLGDRGITGGADVYSLGVMLFQLVSGRTPFLAKSMGPMLAAHITDTPPPLAEVAPGVPPALARLVARMLAKASAERPSVSEVAEQLERIEAADHAHPTMMDTPTPVAMGPTPTPASIAPTVISAHSQMTLPTHRTGRHLAIGAGVVAALVALLLVVMRHPNVPTTATPPAAPVAPPPTGATAIVPPREPPPPGSDKVLWLIKSDPPRAEIVRVADGVRLGVTPWYGEEARGNGTVEVAIRLSGYVTQQAKLDRASNARIAVKLVAKPKRSQPADDDLQIAPLH
ncbi:MAG: serine/threonine protein kinase [Myxococcales bacterium]|nr:serine/threonine protein kinase [Myxococcales bacterium]